MLLRLRNPAHNIVLVNNLCQLSLLYSTIRTVVVRKTHNKVIFNRKTTKQTNLNKCVIISFEYCYVAYSYGRTQWLNTCFCRKRSLI